MAVLATLATFVTVVHAQPQPRQGGRPILIRELAVEGNRRVQEAVIAGRVRSTVGQPFNPSQASEDLRAIFGLGFFDDVQMKVEDFEGGVKVTFVVVERPFVRDLEFTGNSKLGTTELQEKIDLKLGSVYNPVDVQRGREKLKDAYEDEGYFEVQISAEVEKFEDGDVKVVFAINEGRRITIDKIVIRGNTGLKDKQIKEVMAVKERQYYILRGTVQRQKLDEDIERILSLYQDHGFVQMRVESVRHQRRPRQGPGDHHHRRGRGCPVPGRHHQGQRGDPGARGGDSPPARLQERRRVLPFGAAGRCPQRHRSLQHHRSGLRRRHSPYRSDSRGRRSTSPSRSARGPKSTSSVSTSRATRAVRTSILRREIPFVEGDLFTLQKLQRARQRLVNLGYFDVVNVTTQPGTDKNRILVNVDVTERPTGIFSIGGGFSSVDSFVGTLDISQNNFLGRGWQLSLRIRAGGETQQGIISFTEPWLFDRPLAAGFDLFNIRREFDEYDYDSLGTTLRLSHPFQEYWRWQLSYRLTNDDISDVEDTADPLLKDEEGTRVTSAITFGVTRDSRDNISAPTKGGLTVMTLDFAGLGGDSQFVKAIAATTYFKPIWFGHILSGRAEVGYGFGWSDEPLPVFERFYLGGPNTIRSFKARKISPVDDDGNRIGGTTEVLGNLEYLVPLPFNFRAAAFFDIGNVYGFTTKFDLGNTREAAGAGIRWQSPFGPIRVDYGINLDRRKGEDFGAIQFSVGSPF